MSFYFGTIVFYNSAFWIRSSDPARNKNYHMSRELSFVVFLGNDQTLTWKVKEKIFLTDTVGVGIWILKLFEFQMILLFEYQTSIQMASGYWPELKWSEKVRKYSGDLKTGHSKSGIIRKPDVFDIRIFEWSIYISHFKIVFYTKEILINTYIHTYISMSYERDVICKWNNNH